MADDDLEEIEPFFETLIKSVGRRGARRMLDKLMRAIRRSNAARITKNIEPDGGKMTARKPRKGKRGKMFKHIGKQRNLRIKINTEKGMLYFPSANVARTAAEHHFGEEGFVGKSQNGKVIRTKFDARRLLGFGDEREDLMEIALRHIDEGD